MSMAGAGKVRARTVVFVGETGPLDGKFARASHSYRRNDPLFHGEQLAVRGGELKRSDVSEEPGV
jgi:hypothetical protein